jgi:hypothetical protein
LRSSSRCQTAATCSVSLFLSLSLSLSFPPHPLPRSLSYCSGWQTGYVKEFIDNQSDCRSVSTTPCRVTPPLGTRGPAYGGFWSHSTLLQEGSNHGLSSVSLNNNPTPAQGHISKCIVWDYSNCLHLSPHGVKYFFECSMLPRTSSNIQSLLVSFKTPSHTNKTKNPLVGSQNGGQLFIGGSRLLRRRCTIALVVFPPGMAGHPCLILRTRSFSLQEEPANIG